MARLTATNFSASLQFPYGTAATDLFKKEDVQTMALAVDQHDHSPGKGVATLLPTNITVAQDAIVNRDLSVARNLNILDGSKKLHASAGAGTHLIIEATVGSMVAAAAGTNVMTTNATWDGTTWTTDNSGAWSVNIQTTGLPQIVMQMAPPGAVPSWTTIWTMDNGGNEWAQGNVSGSSITARGGQMAYSGN